MYHNVYGNDGWVMRSVQPQMGGREVLYLAMLRASKLEARDSNKKLQDVKTLDVSTNPCTTRTEDPIYAPSLSRHIAATLYMVLPPFLNIRLFRDFKLTTTYRCI